MCAIARLCVIWRIRVRVREDAFMCVMCVWRMCITCVCMTCVCMTCMYDMYVLHVCMWHDGFVGEKMLSCTCVYDMCVWHVCMTCVYVTWRIGKLEDAFMYMCVWHVCMTCVYDMSIQHVTWLIHTRINEFLYATCRAYVTWLVHLWHDSFICDMTHSYVPCIIRMWTWRVHVCLYSMGARWSCAIVMG